MAESQFIEVPLLFIGLIFVIGFASSIVLDKYRVPHVVVYLLTGFAFALIFKCNFEDLKKKLSVSN